MTTAEYNVFTADLLERVRAGVMDPETLRDPETGAIKDADAVVSTPEAQAVIRYFYTKLVLDSAKRPPFSGPALTPRQISIVRLLADGHPNKEIGWCLGLPENTVKTYICNLRGRINCANRWQVGLWAREHWAWVLANDTLGARVASD